jgi:hypothetical protein
VYLLYYGRRSQRPRGLRCRSTAARLLRSWVRIPPEAWMFVYCVCCQVEVSATSWSLVQRSPIGCGASLCVITEPRERGGHSPRWAAEPEKTIIIIIIIIIMYYCHQHVSETHVAIYRAIYLRTRIQLHLNCAWITSQYYTNYIFCVLCIILDLYNIYICFYENKNTVIIQMCLNHFTILRVLYGMCFMYYIACVYYTYYIL